MKKQWFDKRAEDGREWVVVRREVEEFLIGQFIFKKTITYIPEQKHKANRMNVVARGLTKAEALAMVKLLEAFKQAGSV